MDSDLNVRNISVDLSILEFENLKDLLVKLGNTSQVRELIMSYADEKDRYRWFYLAKILFKGKQTVMSPIEICCAHAVNLKSCNFTTFKFYQAAVSDE